MTATANRNNDSSIPGRVVEPPSASRRQVLIAGAAGAGAVALDVSCDISAQAQTLPHSPSVYTTRGPAPTVTSAVHTRFSLKAELINAKAFAPFGVVMTETGRHRLPINTYGDRLDLYREDFASDQPIEWFIVNGRPRWNGVLFLERHMQLTQTFIPMGKPILTVVARADAKEENGFPMLSELKAFFVPGDTAFQIHRGTWHENPMPVADNTRLLVTSHANLTVAHQQNPDPKLSSLTPDLERRWYKAGGFEITVTT
jgi:ureidoglycolate hydrolase